MRGISCMNVEYLISACTDPYRNLALEQWLMGCADEETAILFLWQNDQTIVVGRNQAVDRECRVEEFVHSGGKLARRRSGGGTVFHDLGNQNYSLICPEKALKG